MALALLASTAVGCKSKQPVNGECVFNSECEDGLVCAGRYCRKECNLDAPAETRDRDCPSGFYCGTTGQGRRGACIPVGDPGYCVYASDCREPLVCTPNGQCASQCVQDRDCQVISLDPTARCDRSADVGVCSFRITDGGAETDAASTDAGSSDTGGASDAGAASD
ncbi:MAG: hypothetical protein R3A52_11270 [Polyangiales bacterium]